jgi:hypothetical protein
MFKDLQQEFETGSRAEKLEVLRTIESASDYQSVSLLIHALDDPDPVVSETARARLRVLHPLREPRGSTRPERPPRTPMEDREDLP